MKYIKIKFMPISKVAVSFVANRYSCYLLHDDVFEVEVVDL